MKNYFLIWVCVPFIDNEQYGWNSIVSILEI